jgi:hypothetical protein
VTIVVEDDDSSNSGETQTVEAKFEIEVTESLIQGV